MRQRAMIAMALACDPADRHRRRTDDRPGRDGPGPDPPAARGPPPQAGPVARAHHPRPVGHRRDVRPHDDHVRRADRRGGPGLRGLPPATPPLHPEAAVGVPEHPRRSPGARCHPGLAARPAQPATGLPVRAALRVRDGHLHGGRAARGHLRRRPGRLPPLSGGQRRRPDHRPAGASRRARRAAGRAGSDDRPRSRHDRRSRRSPRHRRHRSPRARAGRGRGGPKGPPGIESPGWPLIEVRGLEVHFPIRGGFMDTLRRTAARRRPGRGRHRPDPPARRGPRPGRRVGQRQDDDRPGHRQADQADRRQGPVRGRGRQRAVGASPSCGKYRRRVQLIFQDPYETLNPKQTIFDFVAEPLAVNGLAKGEERVAAGLRGARGGRVSDRRPTSPTASRTSCRAASASASSSPGRW